MVDAPNVDAGLVSFGDTFEGATLSTQWNASVAGLSPQGMFSLTGGALRFETAGESNDFLVAQVDSTRCSLGSSTGNLATFTGRQIVMDVPIGTRDFTLEFEIGWDESNPGGQVGQYGVALTDASHHVLLAGTFIDSMTMGAGRLLYFVRASGATDLCADPNGSNPAGASGRVTYRFVRAGGSVRIFLGTRELSNPVGEPFIGDVAHVAILNNGSAANQPPAFVSNIFSITGTYQP